MPRRANLFTAEPSYDESDPGGYRSGSVQLGPDLGATMIGGSVYELPPGESTFPYHYEWGCEEWVIVLAGRPTLRHPEGEDVLEPGDVVCFAEGPEGAHKLTNRGGETARILMLSTKQRPAVAVYPDSDKLGVWTSVTRDSVMVRRESNVDYWDREA